MTADNGTCTGAQRERVERAFAELGLLGDERTRELAVGRARVAVARGERSTDNASERHATTLALAGELFADAAPALASEPALIARLLDRLGQAIGVSRAHVGRELIGRVGLAMLPPELTSETLLALVESGERRLMRVGLDLHDGPLQELLLMADDLRLFRAQLGDVLGDREERSLVDGRLDDLQARLLELERGLRRISTAVDAGAPLDRPFDAALEEVVQAFAQRSDAVASLAVRGDTDAISRSQRIALLSVVGEALNNVREHASGAACVEIEITIDGRGVHARVLDDGCGFDVERALLGAARRGRMGLAGIHERVRLLDGRCVIESRPGGPTSISLTLPRWDASSPATAPAVSPARRDVGGARRRAGAAGRRG
jgi:signal transduction histidine kinase